MTSDAVLVSDPVFQLNILLWALEDLPDITAVRPVLRTDGYELESLGRRLLVPADEPTVSALRDIAGSTDRSPCRPDLCIDHPDDPVTLVVELKSHGFSQDSSNVRQAGKLIVASHDLSASYAETQPRPGHVVYGTVESDAARLAETLQALNESLGSQGVSAAPTATIGISIDDEGARLSTSSLSDLPAPAQRALQTPATVLHRHGEDDIRPLYVIPWIPGIEGTQDPELQADGYRELTARVVVEAMAVVGQAIVPTTLNITGAMLLSRATFGVFDRWLDADRQQFAAAATGVLTTTLQSLGYFRRQSRDTFSLSLSSHDEQAEVIKLLEQAKPADNRTNIEAAVDEAPRLFDDF
ncbi:MAG: hypothetical protein F4Y12_13920 [Acidimicrobiaceae bacterium]|nr:hypothetical protein [Acidimicrobiaceae bacterium]MYH77907.1 hypothetical protein [Acidimicrobiaceae bacterium]